MSSENHQQAYVWVWLPGEVEPVVAGKLESEDGKVSFNYGQSYLERVDQKPKAISLWPEELPLQAGALSLKNNLSIPGCIRDAAPDAWGRRVIINKLMGSSERSADTNQLNELTYLLESGSDRIGALDFQDSPTEYKPRLKNNATLEELSESAERVLQGTPLTPELDAALLHGSSIGGARPKALIEDQTEGKKYIAKFSTSTDVYNVVKAEYVAMRLAQEVGLFTANVKLTQTSGKDVLLVERFDREKTKQGWARSLVLSALTLFGLDETEAQYASYEHLAELIRLKFEHPTEKLTELYCRMTFNILCGNTDDHARNHAALWNGETLRLSPAYDICPILRQGGEATQAMKIHGDNRLSRISNCLQAAEKFKLSNSEAKDIYVQQRLIIETKWQEICEEAELSEVDRNALWGRAFLNPFCYEDL